MVRNDRPLGAAKCLHDYEQIKDLDQLGSKFLHRLTQVQIHYNALNGKRFAMRRARLKPCREHKEGQYALRAWA
jgi:hypothetical protein